jgi:hypothetical protein
MPGTPECAETFLEIYNVTTPDIVMRLTDINAQLHGICKAFTSQVHLSGRAPIALLMAPAHSE